MLDYMVDFLAKRYGQDKQFVYDNYDETDYTTAICYDIYNDYTQRP